MTKFNSLSAPIGTLLKKIDNQVFIDKVEEWLSSQEIQRKAIQREQLKRLEKHKNPQKNIVETSFTPIESSNVLVRFFENGHALTEIEEYAVFVALAETVCRGYVNQYLYPYDEPLGIKRVHLDVLACQIKECPDDWITDFEGIVHRIAKRHSIALSTPGSAVADTTTLDKLKNLVMSMSRSKSKNLLDDLVSNRGRVQYDPVQHGKGQPKDLREIIQKRLDKETSKRICTKEKIIYIKP